MLEVRLLGQFELRIDGMVQVLPSRPAQSLLAYLVLHAGIPQRRERLAGLLWPDRSDVSARRNLRTALWQIRKALGEEKAAAGGYILADGITTTFNQDSAYWLDASALEGAAEAGRTSTALIEIVSLYRGELLPGFYDDWVVLERDRLEAVFEAGMVRLLGLLLAEERWSDVLAWSGRWIAFGRAPEPAYRALMAAHAGLRDLPSVARVYNRCQEALREELGVEPSAETAALYEALIRGESPAGLAPQILPGSPARATSVQLTDEAAVEPAPGDAPFQGLRAFDEEDANLFFGRETLVKRLLARLETDPSLLVVVGASGSGKSSLVRAGLIPALKRAWGSDEWPGSGEWQVRVIRPTAQPLDTLAHSLTGGAPVATAELVKTMREQRRALAQAVQSLVEGTQDRLLLVVDHFEELFTLCENKADRRALVDNLVTATGLAIPLTVVIALRADFYAHCGEYPALREALVAHQEYIGPMNADELRRAIEGPAQQGGWRFSPGLVDLILRDAGEEPGSLPLLSHALLETWKRRQGRTLTLAGYAASGGVHGSIARTAQWVYQGLPLAEQAIARSAFLRLTALGEGTQDTRRRVEVSELIPTPEVAPLVHHVLAVLADARLITMSDDGVEVAHEALIREWPSLRRWLAEDRDGLRLHRRLTVAAREWEALGQDPSALYRGTRLAKASEWAETHDEQLNELERSFVGSSQAQAEHEVAQQEAQRQRELEASRQLALAESQRAAAERRAADRARRGARYLAAALAVTVLLAGLAAFLGYQARSMAAAATMASQQAEQQRRLATARELAAAAVTSLETDPERSILLAMEAINATYLVDGTTTVEAETALHRALARSRLVHRLPPASAGPIRTARYSPDGRQIATVSDAVVTMWDLASMEPAFVLPDLDFAASVAFSPDGRRIATADASGIVVWDITGAHVAGTGLRTQTLTGHTQPVVNVVFGPGGQLLASAGDDGQIILWNVRSGQALHRFSSQTGDVVSYAIAFSPDGLLLAGSGAENTVRIYDVASGEERAVLRGHSDMVAAAAFSPDGIRLVTAGTDTVAKIWDVASGRETASLVNHSSLVWDATFSPDGTQVLTASFDGTARVWDAASGRELFALAGHEIAVLSAAFSPDGSQIATTGDDGAVRIWSAQSPAELPTLRGHAGDVFAVALNPDGQMAATAGGDGFVRVWDLATGGEVAALPAGKDGAPQFAVAFSPDGRRLAVSGKEPEAGVWDLDTGRQVLSLRGHGPPLFAIEWLFRGVQDITYSPNGALLATAGADGTARLWDASSGEQLRVLQGHDARLNSVRFSPNGEHLATAADDSTVKLWAVASGELLATLNGHSSRVWVAEFSPDGTRLASGGADTVVKLWDVASREELLSLAGHTSTVNGLAFSPDDQRLASASGDTTTRLWDATTGQEVVTLHADNTAMRSPVFGPDGNTLVVGTGAGPVHVYVLQIDQLMQLAKERVTRSLTTAECHKYLHLDQCPTTP
jgi:WD40 repeat protein/DNA-binding SARP family transcriptional activator